MVNGRAKKPKDFLEVEDYNGGIELRATLAPYLTRRSAKSKTFFSALLAHPNVRKFQQEVSHCATKHSKEKDPVKHRINFTRWHELKNMIFAKELADSCT